VSPEYMFTTHPTILLYLAHHPPQQAARKSF
jgi:hypothetical protein